jgi:hypothetical protein
MKEEGVTHMNDYQDRENGIDRVCPDHVDGDLDQTGRLGKSERLMITT